MKVVALQYTASSDLETNLEKIESLLQPCRDHSIDLCVLPENFALMANSSKEKLAIQETLGEGKVQTWLSKLSEEFNMWLVAGSFPISSKEFNRPYARCLVYRPDGNLDSYYDKIHLFDVAVSSSESYCESSDTFAGDKPVTIQVNDFKVGLNHTEFVGG